jgi:hypothetical protein
MNRTPKPESEAVGTPTEGAAKRAPAVSTRREFLRIAAIGSAVALLPAAAGTAEAARRAARRAAKRSKPAKPAKHAEAPQATALAAEIEKQKKATADALKTIRAFVLPPGSEQAFVFAAMPAEGDDRPAPRAATKGGAR